eukprot:3394623-Pleurochrysis_carterae.AAC.2
MIGGTEERAVQGTEKERDRSQGRKREVVTAGRTKGRKRCEKTSCIFGRKERRKASGEAWTPRQRGGREGGIARRGEGVVESGPDFAAWD